MDIVHQRFFLNLVSNPVERGKIYIYIYIYIYIFDPRDLGRYK